MLEPEPERLPKQGRGKGDVTFTRSQVDQIVAQVTCAGFKEHRHSDTGDQRPQGGIRFEGNDPVINVDGKQASQCGENVDQNRRDDAVVIVAAVMPDGTPKPVGSGGRFVGFTTGGACFGQELK